MNSTATAVSLSSQLNQIQIALARYCLLPVYVLGNAGNLANLALFSKRSLRSNNICAWYFLGVSMANLIGLNVGGLTRILALLNSFTLESTSLVFCKCRNYFIQSSALVGRYFLCLISIDRWVVTSSNESIRRWSSRKVAKRLITVGVLTLVTFSMHIPIGFSIRNGRCYAYLNDSYTVFFNVYNSAIIVLPIVIMTSFSVLTLINIRRSRVRIVPIVATASHSQTTVGRSHAQRDLQFIRLAFGQVLVFMVFIITYGIFNMYDLITSAQTKGADQRAVETFISGLVVNLNYISISITFYTYTLASNTFRKECVATVMRLCKSIYRSFQF